MKATRSLYRGRRGVLGPRVEVSTDGTAEPLAHVVRHSPDGFEWGYPGSGPADLALSILADALGEKQTEEQAKHYDTSSCVRAFRFHQEFKREFVVHFGSEWEMAVTKVVAWLEAREAEALLVEQENIASG